MIKVVVKNRTIFHKFHSAMNFSFERKWKRPSNDAIPFPHVWNEFTVTQNGRTLKLKIQDLTPEQHDEVWDMFKEHFYLDDEVVRVANQIEDEVTMTSQTCSFMQCARENMSIVAVVYDEDREPTIAGALIFEVVSKDDPPFPMLPGRTRAKIQNLFKILYGDIDEFEKLNVDKCFKDYAIVVKREYRRLGIGSKLFLTMEKMAKTFNIPAAVVIFNNASSQALASKLEYSVLSEVKLKNYVDEDGQVILPTTNTEVVRLCYKYFR